MPHHRPLGPRCRSAESVFLPVLVLAAVLAAACAPESETPEVPGIEGWTGEPQVAAKIEEARQAVLADPGSAQAFGRLGMIFQAHDLHTEAVACYARAAELAPDEGRWPYLAAQSMRQNDLEAAVGLFEEAARRGIDHPAFHVGYGDVLAQLGRAEPAQAAYRKALELDPKVTHALYGLAQLALAKGAPEEAREHLEQAAAIAPWHGQVHTLLAQTYQRLGLAEDAARELEAAGAYPDPTQAADPVYQEVEAEAVNTLAYGSRGRRLAREGRFAEAEEQYRKVLELRTATATATAGDYSNLGGVLAGQGKIDEAIALYEKALELDDDDPYALNNLAMALAQKGEPEKAVEHLSKAVAIEPAYPEAHHNLGLVRASQRRFSDAIEHYREALSHNPSFAAAHNDLGTALAGMRDLDAAIGHWRRALEIDPRQLGARYNLSLALVQRGEHREAVERLEKGMAIAPNSSRLVSLLAWELATAPDAGLRDPARAEQLARRVYDAFSGQPQMGDVLAAALAAQGRFDEAVTVAEGALAEARRLGQGPLEAQISLRLKLYQRQQAFEQRRTAALAPR